ncbi:PE family protein [Mycobacterium aquaticum]|nr:PE family protein [Mycobacterium aquaticum]
MSGLSIETQQLTEVGARLDAIAGRLSDLLQAEHPHLDTVPVGRDEVSARASSTLNTVHASYAESAEAGIAELREIAAALRSNTGKVIDADAEFTA